MWSLSSLYLAMETTQISAGRALNTPTANVAQHFPSEDLYSLVYQLANLTASSAGTFHGTACLRQIFFKGSFF